MSTDESTEHCGYCDLHLEAKLIPCASLIAGLYGGDSANANPFEFWRCSNPDCIRCYEPYMFGYFNLDRQRGASIGTNPAIQERCEQHDQRPFMCIGRFGEGRRFRCLMHGCDSVGLMVAACVADSDEVKERPDTTPVLTGDERKEAFELITFTEFASAAGLPLDLAENAKPPHPDIRCRIGGNECWFELGRITDSKLAKALNSPWPKAPTPFSFAQKEPFVRIIEKKAKAPYVTNGRPVDLLLHFDHQPPDREALKRHLQEHVVALNHLRQHGPFSRIWIFDGWSKSVLWQSAE